jgi:large subunit ribosomal protein L10
MNRDQKAAVIDEVAAQIEEAQAIFAVDYRGLTVRQAADLRGRLVEIEANLRVVKNTLTERAADKAGAEVLKQFLEGPTAFTFVKGDPVLAAKALAAFRRESQRPEFKGGLMDGRELSAADIDALSRLPSLDVMHGQLVGMVAAPLSGLVRSLNALLSGIAVALGQIQEQGLVGQAPAPAEASSADAGEAPADAISPDADDAPTSGGDDGVAADAAAPAAEAAAEPAADAPAADAAAADAAAAADSSPAEAVGVADSPSAPADAPEPAAAEEIPNQPMPPPEQAATAADDNETSNEEGDN